MQNLCKSIKRPILKGILHTEVKTNIAMKGQELLNLKRTADK
jgi:hypothetical protein